MIVVTGGCGFIGSNLVKKISKLGFDEICVVDQRGKIIQSKHELAPYVKEFVDYQDFIQNLDSLSEGDIIYHQGACTNTMNYDSVDMMYKNFDYSKALFDFCYRSKVRLIYASSAAVYGNHSDGLWDESREYENPLNVYGRSKLLFDDYVRCFEPQSQVVGLRYFNVYGPGEQNKGKMASTIFQFFNQIKDDGIVRPFEGSDKFVRDFVYIEDVINLNLFFFHQRKLSGIFNCGTGETHSFMQIVEELKKYYKFDIMYKKMPSDLAENYQTYTRAKLLRLKMAGYRFPFIALEAGIEKYVKVLENCQK
jgi:ADP-L-glycero-D-manno-heptose 6-epimerase